MKKSYVTDPRPDSMESAFNLVLGFLGALLVTVVGTAINRGSDRFWLGAFFTVLVMTAYSQSLLPAAYNGFVSGLFYNAFFLSSDRGLTFEQGSEWLLELAFISTAVCAAVLGYLVRRFVAARHSDVALVVESSKTYRWIRQQGESDRRGHRWTR
jgi:hypothetical protein